MFHFKATPALQSSRLSIASTSSARAQAVRVASKRSGATLAPADVESEKQKRRDALHRGEALLAEAAK
jgi:hypothetical protein